MFYAPKGIQKKTFTRWCNSHLRERGITIEDLFADVSDGTVLLNLLEIIGGETIKSTCGRNFYPPSKVKMDIHKLENCNLIFDYLKARELKLVNIGSTDVKDGNPRLVLGLIWTIILRFAISEDGKEGLLLWCRKNTAGYAGVDVQNFNRSWADGLAFCALIHKFRPDLINFDECAAREDPLANLNAAFTIAAEQLDIPALLDAEDVCGSAKPDEKSIIAYLSLYFQRFAAMAQKDALADAIKRALNVTMHHEEQMSAYTAASESLLSWVRVQTSSIAKNAELDCSTTDDVKSLIEASHAFKNDVKPPKQQELASTEALLANLRLSQRNNERPLYAPAIEVEDLEGEWADMEKAEKDFETASLTLLDAFEHTDFALQRLNAKVAKVEAFCEANEPVFASGDYGDSVAVCTDLKVKVSIFEQQQPKYKTTLDSCSGFVGMCHEKHSGTAQAKARYDTVVARMASLVDAVAAFKKGVEAALEEQVRLANLKEKYEADLADYEFELGEIEEVLLEPISLCNSVSAIVEVTKRTEEVKTLLLKSEETLVSLESMAGELGRDEAAGMRSKFAELQGGVDKRFASLGAAQTTQESKELIKAAFVEASGKLMDFCSETSRVLSSLTRRMSVTAEKQAEKLDALVEKFGAEGSPLLDAVEVAHESQVAAGVFVNNGTNSTVFSCRLVYAECEKNLKSAVEINSAHILAMNGQMEMSAEQAKEIREAFDAFDKDKSGKLTLKEFQDGIMSMGVVVGDDESETEFKKRDTSGDGLLTYEEFAAYLLDLFTSGSSKSDVLAAFKNLVDGKCSITGTERQQWFGGSDKMVSYMQDKMGDAGEIEPFVETMFSV